MTSSKCDLEFSHVTTKLLLLNFEGLLEVRVHYYSRRNLHDNLMTESGSPLSPKFINFNHTHVARHTYTHTQTLVFVCIGRSLVHHLYIYVVYVLTVNTIILLYFFIK